MAAEAAAAAAAAAELAAWEAEERSRRHGWLNYDDFTRALAAALPFPSKREAVGGARLFLSLHLDAYGRARATSLHRAACTVAQLLSTRIDLAALDPGNTGRLDEPALESFVQACVPKIRRLAGHSHLRPGHSFEPFYVAHCTRKLLLALGGRRRCGWVSVEELLLSPQLSDLFSLCAADDNGDGDGAAAESALEEGCWFSLQRAIKVYRKFLELDGDHDGMLTSDELLQFGEEGMALTPAFCERLFEVVHTYDGRLDYKGYLDFVIALDHRGEAAGLAYFWRVLDLHSRGSIGLFELHYFIRDVVQGLLDAGDEPTELENIIDEIIDPSGEPAAAVARRRPPSPATPAVAASSCRRSPASLGCRRPRRSTTSRRRRPREVVDGGGGPRVGAGRAGGVRRGRGGRVDDD